MRWLLTSVLLVIVGSAPAQQGFTFTSEPTHQGVRAVVDLPLNQHKRNVGGSDGAGLCVYTSFWHSAIWASVKEVFGFRAYMERRPGGSYPDKFAATLNNYCREKGIPVPAYIQHTGGDVEVLELALKTGRCPAVTYCGVDPFYGNQVIAHMVTLVHLDSQWACIIDNNNPGKYLWMPRDAFIARWQGVQRNGQPYLIRMGMRAVPVGGGWTIILLDSPPPPYPKKPTDMEFGQQCQGNRWGTPGSEPVWFPAGPVIPANPAKPSTAPGVIPGTGKWIPHVNGVEWYYWVGDRCLAVGFTDGHCESTNQYGIATGKRIQPPVPLPFTVAPQTAVGEFPPGGVDPLKLNGEPQNWISGQKCSKSALKFALIGGDGGLIDDSSKWHLTVVGDEWFRSVVKSHLDKLPKETIGKLHVKFYEPSQWEVSQFSLSLGVTLRAPAVDRMGSELGFVDKEKYTKESLNDLLAAPGGPIIRPIPIPIPIPTPVDPNDPNPPKTNSLSELIAVFLLGVLGWFLARKKETK